MSVWLEGSVGGRAEVGAAEVGWQGTFQAAGVWVLHRKGYRDAFHLRAPETEA